METFNFEAQCGAHISCSFNFEATLSHITSQLQVKNRVKETHIGLIMQETASWTKQYLSTDYNTNYQFLQSFCYLNETFSSKKQTQLVFETDGRFHHCFFLCER